MMEILVEYLSVAMGFPDDQVTLEHTWRKISLNFRSVASSVIYSLSRSPSSFTLFSITNVSPWPPDISTGSPRGSRLPYFASVQGRIFLCRESFLFFLQRHVSADFGGGRGLRYPSSMSAASGALVSCGTLP